MTFRKQFCWGMVVGILCLGAAEGLRFIDQVMLGYPPESSGWLGHIGGALGFIGLPATVLSVWRGFMREVFVRPGTLEHGLAGRFLRRNPFFRCFLHVDKEGRDLDARP